jgi:hypothetical protein
MPFITCTIFFSFSLFKTKTLATQNTQHKIFDLYVTPHIITLLQRRRRRRRRRRKKEKRSDYKVKQ